MKTYCVLIPHEVINEVAAIFMTTWNLTHSNFFRLMLDELSVSVTKPFSLEIYSSDQTIYFCFCADDETAKLLSNIFYTQFSEGQIREVGDYTQDVDEETEIAVAELSPAASDLYPFQHYGDFIIDSMQPICCVLSTIPVEDTIIVQVICKPVADNAALHLDLSSKRSMDRLIHPFRPKYWFKKGVRKDVLERMNEKLNGTLYHVNVRLCALSYGVEEERRSEKSEELKAHLQSLAGAISFMNGSDLNHWKMSRPRTGLKAMTRVQKRSLTHPFRLGTKELSTLYHVPSIGVPRSTGQVLSKRGSPPTVLPSDQRNSEICFFGHTDFREQQIPFGIYREDRKRHMYVVGKSGSGKSCLLQLLMKNDIDHGQGFAVLDPHGDLVDDVLKLIPRHRIKDVVLLDPTDSAFPPSFNPMARVDQKYRMRVTVGFVEIFKKVFGSDWSERMDHVLRFATMALLSTPGATVLSLRKMFADDEYRQSILDAADDEAVIHFWNNEFLKRRQEFEEVAISRFLNRLGQLIASNTLRNIFGQPLSRIDFRQIMDEQKILLVKVSKGILGDDNAALLGAMVISKIYEAAMSRADIAVGERRDFYFYVDEFQNFATDSFDEILSEARKYGLNLTVANQFLGQLPDNIRRTVFGNVGNILSFGVGGDDGAVLSKEFHPRFGQGDIMNLAMRDFYVKMLVRGEVQEAFSGRTLDVTYPPREQTFVNECIEHSRRNYALPIEQVEDMLSVWDHEV